MRYNPSDGLTSKQAYTQSHLTRCPLCGAWEVLTNFEALMRCAPGYVAPVTCSHLTPSHDRKAVA